MSAAAPGTTPAGAGARGELPEQPVVSVVIPMLNEIGAIGACLDAFAAQSWPHDRLELLVVDGGSTDGSRELVEKRAVEEPWIRVVDNPARKAAAAFNRGVEAARGDVVCLFSSHGVPDDDYLRRSVEVLRETGAEGVGGRYRHVGTDPASRATGLAMVSPFGMASPHRWAGSRQEVDTISHPAYRRSALVAVGPFDESLERNSDYELNYRMRAAGMRLLFDPSVSSVYRPRPSLRALGRQFWWYGRWKERVVRRHPGSLRARHLVPPVAVLAACSAPLLLVAGRRSRRLVVIGAGLYAAGVTTAVAQARPDRHHASVPVLWAAFPVMHATWGAGFLVSLLEDTLRRSAAGPGSSGAIGTSAGSGAAGGTP